MPKVNTPITDEEAEAWVQRMGTSVEDFGMTGDVDEWQEFVSSKLLTQQGYEPTEDQINRLVHIQPLVSAKLGYRTDFVEVKGIMQTRLRDVETGRFMSREDATYRIYTWMM